MLRELLARRSAKWPVRPCQHKWHLALRYRHFSLPQSSSASRFTAGRIRVLALDPMPRAAEAIRQLELSLRAVHPLLHAVMHLQIVEAGEQLTLRYVANGPHRQAMWIGLNRKPQWGRNRTNGWNVKWPSIRARGQYHSRRYWIDGRRIRAAPKAPQRKRPCRSRALSVDPSCSFVRCDQPSYAGGFLRLFLDDF
jgi:hypothetical protein